MFITWKENVKMLVWWESCIVTTTVNLSLVK